MSRQPEFVKVNEVTLIDPKTCKFKTFWKNVHQQRLITEGTVYGLTYEVGEKRVVEKDAGNAEYIECRKDGWMKWKDFCQSKDVMSIYYDFGSILY